MAKQKKQLQTSTEAQFSNLNKAFDYFNKALFGGTLPPCILNFSRKRNTHGFFSYQRWKERGKKDFDTHEISLTPTTLYREPILVYSTLVHEQCHLWQYEFGKPSRNGYHNKEWANKMIEVGLMPTDTGQKGGKITGQSMTHYVVKGGAYEKVFEKMPKEFILPFTSLDADLMKSYLTGTTGKSGGKSTKGKPSLPPTKGKNKEKYTCPCGFNVWGKAKLNLKCEDCGEKFEMQ
jgi:predicted SprT family Zn-dependent metalloprotease